MPAGTTHTVRAKLRRRIVPAALISLTAGLCSLLPTTQAALAASPGRPSISVSAGNNESCAIENGKAYCWGDNGSGQIGDGNTTDSSIPVAVNTSGVLAGQTLTQITVGSGLNDNGQACALDAAGKAYCWGDNEFGQLGDGSGTDSSVPVAVDTSGALAGKTLTQISAGEGYTCAVDSAGAAFCWGDNNIGELGAAGSIAGSSVPVAVDTSGALAGKVLTQISTGTETTCALDAAGAAYCWGYNGYGQLGINSAALRSSVPVAVDTSGALAGQTLTQISAGDFATCALDAAGAAYCWGYGGFGQLGDHSSADSSVPVAVYTSGALAGQTLTQVTAGGFHACALDSHGTAYCWGSTSLIGDGKSTLDSLQPVAVDTSGVLAGKILTQISAGIDHTCAVDTNGAAYCWGDDTYGELGNDSSGTTAPVPVLTGPQAPASVTAVPGDTTTTVSWTAPAWLDGGTLAGYTATATPGGETCATTGTASCTITGLTDAHTYSVTAVARTSVGNSGASTPAIVVPGPPGEPTGPIISGDRATKCIDDNGDSTANDTPIVILDCNGSPEQNWTIATDGTIGINGKCMDIYGAENTSKAPVELSACTGGTSQQWQSSNGTLVNPVSGKCLDDPRFNITNGTQLEIYTCNGGLNQQWKLP